MDGATEPRADGAQPQVLRLHANGKQQLERSCVAEMLGRWQTRELRVVRGFTETRGLSDEQLEDLYQQTTLALLHRPYKDEQHLRSALYRGLKQRALNLYRDERRRQEILAESAPGIHVLETARSAEEGPEHSLLLHQDGLVVEEFLSELNQLERRVFRCMAEGMKFNSIAKALGIHVNQARNTTHACERKLDRFLKLYEHGRLCGYRATTIKALQAGKATSEELAHCAIAHLELCAHCRAEHKTSARRLRHAFQNQAAALLPAPMLIARLGWLARASLRTRALQQRLLTEGTFLGTGRIRERAAVLLASGGASAKLTAGIVTAAAIAGSTIAATHALDHPPTPPHHRAPRSTAAITPVAPAVLNTAAVGLPQSNLAVLPVRYARHVRTGTRSRSRPEHLSPGRVVPIPAVTRATANTQREPGGFAYLGVPTTSPPRSTQPLRAAAQTGGGPFSP